MTTTTADLQAQLADAKHTAAVAEAAARSSQSLEHALHAKQMRREVARLEALLAAAAPQPTNEGEPYGRL